MLLQRVSLLLAFTIGCAPSQPVDRATLTDAFVEPRPVDARSNTVGTGGSAGIDGTGGVGGAILDASVRDRAPDRAPDRNPDRGPEAAPPSDAPDVSDAAGEAPPPLTALLVVGNPAMLAASDTRIRTVLATKNLTVLLADDNAMPNVTGVQLVVISGSCASDTLNGKYKDIPLPILSMESADFDRMGMTPTAEADFGEAGGNQLAIALGDHPLAAGLTGNVAVVTMSTNLAFGRPGPGAQRVATLQGMADRAAIFVYPTGAMMPMGTAVAPRIGFFASNDAAARLNDNGVRLFAAAIDFALK